jgi:hypothetical protein
MTIRDPEENARGLAELLTPVIMRCGPHLAFRPNADCPRAFLVRTPGDLHRVTRNVAEHFGSRSLFTFFTVEDGLRALWPLVFDSLRGSAPEIEDRVEVVDDWE